MSAIRKHVAANGDDEKRVTAESGAQKGQKRARFDLIPALPLWQVAELYGRGSEKYGDRNWQAGYSWSLSYAALQRHANLWQSGEDIDPETGGHHMTSVIFHAMALLEFAQTHPENDDRPKPAPPATGHDRSGCACNTCARARAYAAPHPLVKTSAAASGNIVGYRCKCGERFSTVRSLNNHFAAEPDPKEHC